MTYEEKAYRISEIETLLIQKDEEYEELLVLKDKLFYERFELKQEHKHLLENL
tara:strand:+ start:217 stop:375 length:159 start_codon:yes stop_codon:yes gene_type:complete